MKKTFLTLLILFSVKSQSRTYEQLNSQWNSSAQAREKIKELFKNSSTAASLDDFTGILNEEGKPRCIVYPYDQLNRTNHPIWFGKYVLKIAPQDPLFPQGVSQTVLRSSFKREVWPDQYPTVKPSWNFIYPTPFSLVVITWDEVTIPGENFSETGWMSYNFKRHKDLILLSIDFGNPEYAIDSKRTSYGYCW